MYHTNPITPPTTNQRTNKQLKRVPALEFRPDEMVEAARAVDPLLGSLTLSPSSILEEEGEAEGKGEQRRGRDRR